MASIKDCARLTKRIALLNLTNRKAGVAITPMLNGPHGIGKSMILKSVAKELGGFCFVIEGGSLKEGEITGLPFASANEDGSSEVRFIKYNVVNRIFQLEKYYFEKATHEGFLNGSVRLIVKENGTKVLNDCGKETVVSTIESEILAGEDNRFKFGNELSSETKLRLIESGEVKPVLLFIDELNRTELQTQKELMNIILNKSVNGYDFPWFVFIASAVNPCSQNSSYATNEMDPAQLDRFLKLKVSANIDDFVDYAMQAGFNTDVIESIAIDPGLLMRKDSSQEDQSDMSPTPRSWEMVNDIYDSIMILNNSKFFTAEERKEVQKDLRTLIQGKVGPDAARAFMMHIENARDNIKPEQILTLTSKDIPENILEKFRNLKAISQKIIADSVMTWVYNNIDKITKEKNSEKLTNFKSQFQAFFKELSPSIILTTVRLSLTRYGNAFFMKYAPYCSKEALAIINESKAALEDLKKME